MAFIKLLYVATVIAWPSKPTRFAPDSFSWPMSQSQPTRTCSTLKWGAWVVACSVYRKSVARWARSPVMNR